MWLIPRSSETYRVTESHHHDPVAATPPAIRPNRLSQLRTDCFSDEERDIRDTSVAFVRDRVIPNVGTCSRRRRFPVSGRKSSGSSACWGCTSRATAGARRRPPTAYGLGLHGAGKAGDSGRAQAWSRSRGSLGDVRDPIGGARRSRSSDGCPRWPGARRSGLLRADRARLRLGPGIRMRTRARRDGDDWIWHGQKMWITNGSIADVAWCGPGTDDGVRVPGSQGHQGLHHAGDPQEAPRASSGERSELLLDDVRLPAEALLPKPKSRAGPRPA